MKNSYREVRESAGSFNERRDCTVVATALACRISYEKAHNFLASLGRKKGKGFRTVEVVEALSELGYEAIPVKRLKQKNGCAYTPTTIGDKLKKGYYLCIVNHHAFAVVNGNVEDWSDGRRHRIKKAWKIVKKHN